MSTPIKISKHFDSLFRYEKKDLITFIVYSIESGIFSLGIPIAVGALVNTISFVGQAFSILILGPILLGVLLLSSLFKICHYFATEKMELRFFLRNYCNFLDSLSTHGGKKPDYFWELISIQKNIKSLFIELLTIILELVIGFILISFYHPWFLAFTLSIILLSFTLLFVTRNKSLQLMYELSHVKYDLYHYAQEVREKNDEEKRKHLLNEHQSKRKSYFRHVALQNIGLMLIYVLGICLFLCLGGLLVIKEQLSLGQLVASEIIISHLLYNLWKIGPKIESIDAFFIGVKKFGSSFNFSENNLENKNEEGRIWRPIFFLNLLFFISLVLFLVFVPWVQTSKGKGNVIALNPNEREQTIDATVDGRIKRWLVTEGSSVAIGDPIAQMEDLDPNIMERLNQERNALITKLEASKKASELAKKNLDRQYKLLQQGLSSRRDFERAEIEYSSYLSTEANSSADLAKIDTRLSRQWGQFIKATRAGIISRILVKENTTILKASEPIAKLVPQNVLRSVELFLPALDLPLIQQGQKVRLQFEGWPSIQFSGWPMVAIGTFGGKIQNVDPSVDAYGMFRVLVVEEFLNQWPDEKYLRQGMRSIAYVQLGVVKIGHELWRQFNGFPISLPEKKSCPQSSKDCHSY